jgi:hypothetical protein
VQGESTIFAMANFTATGPKAYAMHLGLRNCVVADGKRKWCVRAPPACASPL